MISTYDKPQDKYLGRSSEKEVRRIHQVRARGGDGASKACRRRGKGKETLKHPGAGFRARIKIKKW